MKKDRLSKSIISSRMPLCALAMTAGMSVIAQAQEASPETNSAPAAVEEMVVVGKLKSASENVILERMEQEAIGDILGSEMISRVGDSNVAAALGRLPGITLMDDKFVFVRGLGERDSSSTLNGAYVPSPDLTRNVIPMDIFPTSIVKSISVQKSFSADMPAQFGGGSVDIRTKGIPDGFVMEFEIGTGSNTEAGDFLTYQGGGDDNFGSDDGTRALSPVLMEALNTYRGNIDTGSVSKVTGDSANAAAINRSLALELNRDLSVDQTSGREDISAGFVGGNVFDVNNNLQFGFLSGLSYDSGWKNSSDFSRDISTLATGEAEDIDFKNESTFNVSITGNVNMGVNWNDLHSIESTSIFIRNTDDKTSVTNAFDNDLPVTQNQTDRQYKLRFEQREVRINQLHGKHQLGEFLNSYRSIGFLEALTADWYYSDSTSETGIPNEVRVEGSAIVGSPNAIIADSQRVALSGSSADYRFTQLDDEVESYGWHFDLPLFWGKNELTLTSGLDYWQKSRTYRQTQFGLGTINPAAANSLAGNLSDVFSDANILNDELGYSVSLTGSNSESYIAVARVNALYSKADWTFDETWRVTAGLRWEDYQHVTLGWEPLDFDGSQILTTENQGQEAIASELNDSVFIDDELFPSISLTYMLPGFWAEEFQLRLGYSGTTVRPDLREISESSYFDPVTDFLVFGNPDVVPAMYDNLDLRAEWFFNNSDTFTVSAFYKTIDNPIDQREIPAFENTIALGTFNNVEATIAGLEAEFVVSLGRFSDMAEPFFVQGNFTVQDTESTKENGERVDLYGASDYVANLILGFDSSNGEHAATLSYNTIGERFYFDSLDNKPDAYQRPTNQLNLTYFYYPTDTLTIKAKAKNLLDDNVELEKGNILTYQKEVGVSFSLSAKYEF